MRRSASVLLAALLVLPAGRPGRGRRPDAECRADRGPGPPAEPTPTVEPTPADRGTDADRRTDTGRVPGAHVGRLARPRAPPRPDAHARPRPIGRRRRPPQRRRSIHRHARSVRGHEWGHHAPSTARRRPRRSALRSGVPRLRGPSRPGPAPRAAGRPERPGGRPRRGHRGRGPGQPDRRVAGRCSQRRTWPPSTTSISGSTPTSPSSTRAWRSTPTSMSSAASTARPATDRPGRTSTATARTWPGRSRRSITTSGSWASRRARGSGPSASSTPAVPVCSVVVRLRPGLDPRPA